MSDPKVERNPRRMEFVKITVTLPFPLLSVFDEHASRLGYTRSEALRQSMRKMLETWTGRAY
jgi:metal-responsive CopG/Arc/MetJ family transcriptional regulator